MSDKPNEPLGESSGHSSGQPQEEQPKREVSEYTRRLAVFWAAPTFAGLWEIGQYDPNLKKTSAEFNIEPSWLLYAMSRKAYRHDYLAFFDICSQILANFAAASEEAINSEDEDSDDSEAETVKQNEKEEEGDDS
ncbi:hypothetical protein M434DRAFT_381883 [Hypoxylon sp. CO27-5]|nr:hypothetical protein M434DRAFT_381883 [Hypoxylon sp. CO27-5]